MPTTQEIQHRSGTAMDAVRRGGGEASDAVRGRAAKAGESISGAAEAAVGTVSHSLDAAREGVAGRVRDAGATADKITSTAVRTAKQYPTRSVLIAVAVVAAAGFIAGILTSKRA